MKKLNLYNIINKLTIFCILFFVLMLIVACSKTNYYTVIVNMNDDEGNVLIYQIEENHLFYAPTQPYKEDYNFIGWYEVDTTIPFDTPHVIDRDYDVEARYEIDKELATKYEVSFYFDNKIFKTLSVYQDRTVKYINAPEKEGYTFVEWRYNGVAYDFRSQVVSDIRLDAYYVVNKYVVSLFVNGEKKEVSVEYDNCIVIDDPVKDGYDFVGWFDYNDEEFDMNTKIHGPVELYAKFKRSDGSSINIEYDFGYDCFETKDDLRIAFLTDFYNFLLDKSYDFNRINIESIDDFLEYFNTWKVGNRSDLYHTGDSFGNLYVTVDIDGKVEDQPVDTFIGYCYQNNKYRDFINHLVVFFEYWRTDEGYSQTDPHGNDFFAEPWASMVDTAKFFFFTSENLHDKYRWFNSDRVNYALDHIPGVGYVKLVYSDSEHDYVELPQDVTRDGYEFLGWYDSDGNLVTKVYGDIKVYAKWEQK